MMAYPMDTGPTALFYRTDIFTKAGIDIDPAAVAEHAPDWETYIALGQKIKQAVPGSAITNNVNSIFAYRMAQQPKRYMTAGRAVHRRPGPRPRGVRSRCPRRERGPVGQRATRLDRREGHHQQRQARAFNAAVWWAQLGPKNAAPKTKGLWRVAAGSGGAGNRGGSFLAITKYCKNPEAAFAFISWLESAKNQAEAFLDPVLFPSTPATYTDPRLTAPDPFFGGQQIVDIFAESAKKYPGAYFSPYDTDHRLRRSPPS